MTPSSKILTRGRAAAIAALALVLLFALAAWKEHRANDPMRRGGAWLVARFGAVRDPGVLWAMSEMNERCGDDGLQKKLQNAFVAEFGRHPVEKAYAPLVGLPATQVPDSGELAARRAYYDDILLPIIYCESAAVPASVYATVFDGSASGYDLTHRFLALHFLKEFGCQMPEQYELGSSTAAIARKIAAELAENSFGDLYAEQAAMLVNFGYEELLPKLAMDTIRAYRHQDGGWGDEGIAQGDSNSHTTALALWAESGHEEACPF